LHNTAWIAVNTEVKYMVWSALLDDFRTLLVSPEFHLVDLELLKTPHSEEDQIERSCSEEAFDPKIRWTVRKRLSPMIVLNQSRKG
jgi:hypothetical protein